ncbi:MAG: ATPase domain-containing protein [Chloroflexia bacterium]
MTDTIHQSLPRVPSGIEALDLILKGGFLEGGIYMVMGKPGAGKTILGNQICFNHVANGHRAVYMTLLTETHARMLAHLHEMAFYDPASVGDALTYISGYTTLEREGLSGFIKLVTQVIREYKCTVLIIDGIATAEATSASEIEYRRFLHELQVLVETMRCTAFLLAQPSRGTVHPEHTMVDGVIRLTDTILGPRAVRELEVTKFRGSNYLRGLHSFEITTEGISLYPRIEARLANNTHQISANPTRKTFGVQRFDEMLHGGLVSGSCTTLLGAPGSGKTVLGLHFLHTGLQNGEKALYLGFYESPERLVAKALALGLDLRGYIESGQLTLRWIPNSEIIPDLLAEDILDAVYNGGIKRLFLDGIEPFHDSMIYPERTSRFFTALMNELLAYDVTTCITAELPDLFSDRINISIPHMSALVDNVIFLRYVELRSQLYRLISIMKLRDSDYDPSIREFRISEKGISVASTFRSAEAILTGVARPLPIENKDSADSEPDTTVEKRNWDVRQDRHTENDTDNRR